MKAYKLYLYESYESDEVLGYYLSKEQAEKEQERLMIIQNKVKKRIYKYNSLSPERQQETNYPNIPTEFTTSDIEVLEIEIIESK